MEFQQLVDTKSIVREQLVRRQLSAADFKTNGTPETLAGKREDLRQAAKEFESIFLYQMVAAMRKTVGEGGLIDKGQGEKVFEGLLDEEWSKKLAGQSGDRGLAEAVYQQLSRSVGLESSPPPKRDERGFMRLVLPSDRPCLLYTSPSPRDS